MRSIATFIAVLMFAAAAVMTAPTAARADAEVDALKARLELLEKEMIAIKAVLDKKDAKPAEKGVEISGVGFLSYAYDTDGLDKDANEFTVDRWYLNVRKKVSDRTSVRFTTDVKTTPDGNFDAYMKYGYAQISNVLFGADLVAGLQDTPWIGNEDAAWKYRMQQKGPSDLAGLLNSVDFGLGFKGKFEAGDWHLLLANGEGGNRRERDTKKDIQGRVSFKLGNNAPRLSLYSDIGSVNRAKSDRFGAGLNQQLAQFSYGVSFMEGSDYSAATDTNVKERVYSIYGNYDLTNSPWSIFARYDNNDPVKGAADDVITHIIAGAAVNLDKNTNLSIAAHIDKDKANKNNPALDEKDVAIKAVLQVKY